MARRTYNKAEVYIGDDLIEASATVTFDSSKRRLEVKVGTDKTIHEDVTGDGRGVMRGKDRVREWVLSDDRVLTSITTGCGPCGR